MAWSNQSKPVSYKSQFVLEGGQQIHIDIKLHRSILLLPCVKPNPYVYRPFLPSM